MERHKCMVNSSLCVLGGEVWGWWESAWVSAVRSDPSPKSSCLLLRAVWAGKSSETSKSNAERRWRDLLFFKGKIPKPQSHSTLVCRSESHNSPPVCMGQGREAFWERGESRAVPRGSSLCLCRQHGILSSHDRVASAVGLQENP